MDPRTASFRTDGDGEAYLSGWLVPFRGLFPGDKDTYNTRFSRSTNFALDLFGDRPLLFHHGQDEQAGISAVGRVRSLEVKDEGVWLESWLDKQNEYFGRMVDAAQRGKLFFSSGTLDYLTKINERTGDVEQWPIAEASCTFIPANPFATSQLSYRSHLEEAGITLDEEKLKAFEQLKSPDDLAKRSTREAALSFNQETFVSDDERAAAWQRLVGQALQYQIALSSTVLPSRSAQFHALTATDGDYILILDDGTAVVPAVRAAVEAGVPVAAVRAVLGLDDPDPALDQAAQNQQGAEANLRAAEGSLALSEALRAALEDGATLEQITQHATHAMTEFESRRAAETEAVDLELSYEDIRDDISQMINPSGPFQFEGAPWSCVVATFHDYVIVERSEDGECSYWKIPYTLGDAREPVLGAPVEVEKSYVPAARALVSTGPVHNEAVSLIRHSDALIERTKDLGERRYREGRVISKANHKILKDAHSKMGEAHEAMGNLLDTVTAKTDAQARASDPETWKRQELELELELLVNPPA